MYKTVFFDIDDTLIDFKTSESKSLELCHSRFFKERIDLSQFIHDYSQINHALWDLAEKNHIMPSQIRKERFEKLLRLYKMEMEEDLAPYYEELLICHSEWIPGGKELLEQLVEKKIRIAFISNGFADLQRKKYAKLELNRYSNHLIISEEFGICKPHPSIFSHTLQETNSLCEETLMVGDSLSSDGTGARNIGMDFCWYNPKQNKPHLDWKPTFIIQNLFEPFVKFD